MTGVCFILYSVSFISFSILYSAFCILYGGGLVQLHFPPNPSPAVLLRRPLSLYPLHWPQTSFLEHLVENLELKEQQMQIQNYSLIISSGFGQKKAPPSTIPLSTALATNWFPFQKQLHIQKLFSRHIRI